MQYLSNSGDDFKRIALSKQGQLKPFITVEDDTTMQEVNNGDVVIERSYPKGEWHAFYYAPRQVVKMHSKQIKNKFFNIVRANPFLKEWFNKPDEPFFPPHFTWIISEIATQPEKVIDYYNLDLFLPEVELLKLTKLVKEFKLFNIREQYVNFESEELLNELSTARPNTVTNIDKVRKVFRYLKPDYVNFIIDQNKINDDEIAIHSQRNIDWRYARKLPKEFSLNTIYNGDEIWRFTDVIFINSNNEGFLKTIVKTNRTRKDENGVFINFDVPEWAVRAIYVVHQFNPETRTYNTRWRLFKRKS